MVTRYQTFMGPTYLGKRLLYLLDVMLHSEIQGQLSMSAGDKRFLYNPTTLVRRGKLLVPVHGNLGYNILSKFLVCNNGLYNNYHCIGKIQKTHFRIHNIFLSSKEIQGYI